MAAKQRKQAKTSINNQINIMMGRKKGKMGPVKVETLRQSFTLYQLLAALHDLVNLYHKCKALQPTLDREYQTIQIKEFVEAIEKCEEKH